MSLRVPENAGKFFSSYTTGGFSRRAQLHGVSYCWFSARGSLEVKEQDLKDFTLKSKPTAETNAACRDSTLKMEMLCSFETSGSPNYTALQARRPYFL
jgi:hypothetical protein